MPVRVALVTGANQGIGFAIVKALCEKFDGDVILSARNVERGQEAIEKLKGMNLPKIPKFHQLDITNDSSITNCKNYLLEKYGGLDVLVNNAGIAYKRDATESNAIQAHETLKINFWGTLHMCQQMIPILRDHARLVNVSSVCGCLNNIPSEKVQNWFRRADKDMTIEELEKWMKEYEKSAHLGDDDPEAWKALGYGTSHYGISKSGVTALTKIFAREYNKLHPDKKDVLINCCCPGYVSTNMTSYKGHKTIDEGAQTPVYLALLPPNDSNNPNGQFYSDKKVHEW